MSLEYDIRKATQDILWAEIERLRNEPFSHIIERLHENDVSREITDLEREAAVGLYLRILADLNIRTY